ncbi:serine hydrolase domain-containing protein [Kineosporia sp. NBRC 101677]|uniref:serine hydrolase domain-containing protein n=1 Tax=Kineosporia sp. NBRC 101677 TaxID=3032197 RepID=UPI00255359C4|nr:serine hydrolase domain-containing protein [Kineosporia sp. NBRC 101677]
MDTGRGKPLTISRQARWSVNDHKLAADDRFRMASNTKTVTATLVLQMVAERRLGLDDSVEKWLPGVIPNGENMTLRMLLNHTSGLFDYAWDPQSLTVMTGQSDVYPAPLELIAVATSHPVHFAPGEGYSYSNTGYIALGLILEKVSGRSLPSLIQQRIVKPLGLKDTYMPANTSTEKQDSQLAHGYEPDAAHLAPLIEHLGVEVPEGFGFVGPARGKRVDVTAINPNWNWAAGSMVSTAKDWATFDRALLSGRLLPQAQLNQMRTTVDDGSGTSRYGLGLEEVHSSCGTVWGHEGSLPGYRSYNYTDKVGKRTVSVLNTTHFGLQADPKAGAAEAALVDAAICTMLGKPIPARSSG